MTPLPSRPVLGAHVDGFPAWVIALVLDADLPARIERLQASRADPALIAELRATWARIGEAGRQWQEWRASADAIITALPREATKELPREIGTGRAADALGVTPSRVRQMLRGGQLTGRRIDARTWVVDRASVLVCVEMRRAA